jgi:hypothetical protein
LARRLQGIITGKAFREAWELTLERALLIAAWAITTAVLILFVPKDQIREAFVIFAFKQILTWVLGLSVAELGLLEYPVREFANATKTSFCFEFYVYPSVCVIFNLYFPEGKKKLIKVMHYVYYCSLITVIEVLIERYTNIIDYVHWHWSITWISLFLTFYATRKFYLWYFKLNKSA